MPATVTDTWTIMYVHNFIYTNVLNVMLTRYILIQLFECNVDKIDINVYMYIQYFIYARLHKILWYIVIHVSVRPSIRLFVVNMSDNYSKTFLPICMKLLLSIGASVLSIFEEFSVFVFILLLPYEFSSEHFCDFTFLYMHKKVRYCFVLILFCNVF